VPRGGARSISTALQSVLQSLGGRVVTSSRVNSREDRAGADVTMCDFTPLQFLELCRDELPGNFRQSLEKFRYGPGVYKVDWALNQPIPWKAKDCLRSATVHLGGTYQEICESEDAVNKGELAARPFIILVQPTLFDPSRAPQGMHTAWAYCHVPNGFQGSALEQIQNQIERFAPGFRDCVRARFESSTLSMAKWNENLIGGDINGGAVDWRQFFLRPTRMRYRTPLPGVFFCSASTPPGGAVHGMCGYWAAQAALQYLKLR
jgi:phytoene dehydrogenase-like protein